MNHKSKFEASAYGGENWSPRTADHREEIGSLWGPCGLNAEWTRLKRVLLHPPGPELSAPTEADTAQMLEIPDWSLAHKQHQSLCRAYQDAGVEVSFVDPEGTPSPNLIFCADLFFMTPGGAVLARPASTVRAGEERWVAHRLAALGIPILRSFQTTATLEGADALWVDPHTILIGRGIRTNQLAITQLSGILAEAGTEVVPIDLPIGTMHLMGVLRILDADLAVVWPYRLAWRAIDVLRERGYRILFVPDESETSRTGAFNFVTLGPRQVLMAENNPKTQQFLESQSVICHTIDVSELHKAAGGIGCLTGILERELV